MIMEMGSGKDLWRQAVPAWEETETFLLLNPRLSPALQERLMATEFPELAQHVWIATSGSGGKLKIVALSRDALEASARSVNRHLESTEEDVWLNALPLYHVGGLGMLVRAKLSGARHETYDGAWNPEVFARSAEDVGATLSALVPTQVHDLVKVRCAAPRCLRAVVVGGGALPEKLRAEAVALGWPLLPSYGLTEAASQVATAYAGSNAGEWLPLLEHVEARTNNDGVLDLRGPSLLTGWMIFDEDGEARWEDPKRDGWYLTSDRGELRGRELRVLGRVDDLVKIRGELVDIGALERDLQAMVASGAVTVQCVPDERNGAALRVEAENEESVAQVRRAQDEVFPPYARPREIVVGVVERTALGKTVRA